MLGQEASLSSLKTMEISSMSSASGMKLEISKRKKLRNITDTKEQMSASENAKMIMTKLETNENTTHKSNEMEQSQL